MKKTSCDHYCYIFYNICQKNDRMGVASLHLPAKYPKLPALLVGQIQTLIWRISYNLHSVHAVSDLDLIRCSGLVTPTGHRSGSGWGGGGGGGCLGGQDPKINFIKSVKHCMRMHVKFCKCILISK